MAPKANICPSCMAPITTALVYHQNEDLNAALVAGVWGGWPNGGRVLRITCQCGMRLLCFATSDDVEGVTVRLEPKLANFVWESSE